MTIKRIAAGFWIVAVLTLVSILVLTGCNVKEEKKENKRLSIVSTIYPINDWTKNIVEDKADISYLVDKTDAHNYTPSAEDIIKIQKSDVFIYVGGESDEWVKDVLAKAPGVTPICLVEALNDQLLEEDEDEAEENKADNKDADKKDDTKKDDAHSGESDEEVEYDVSPSENPANSSGEEFAYDEHVWLSLKNAALCVERIADTLGQKDEANKVIFAENAAKYAKTLTDIDTAFGDKLASFSKETLPERFVIVADRNPFKYLFNDYKIDYASAFNGCSAETEASFETVTSLSKKLQEKKLSAIFKLTNSDGSIASSIVSASKTTESCQILSLDSLEQDNKKTYVDTMKENLNALLSSFTGKK